jgi:hypothetical protein
MDNIDEVRTSGVVRGAKLLADGDADPLASTITLSASAAVQTATIRMKDEFGNALAGVKKLTVWIATGIDGATLKAGANGAVSFTTGQILAALAAKQAWDVLTDANGVAVLSINNTGGTDHYAGRVIVCLPSGKLLVSHATDVRSA